MTIGLSSIWYWPKLFKKKNRIEIWTFSFQICFWNQFLTLGSGQTKNYANTTAECYYNYHGIQLFTHQDPQKSKTKCIASLKVERQLASQAMCCHLEPFGAISIHMELFGALVCQLKPFRAISCNFEPFGAILAIIRFSVFSRFFLEYSKKIWKNFWFQV